MNLTPLGSQILLRFLAPPEPKKGELVGITKDEGPTRAVVLKLGSQNRDERGKPIEWEVAVGQIVLVSRHTSGVELKEDGERYCLVREDGLLGVVEDVS